MRRKVIAKYKLVVANRKQRYLEILRDVPYPDQHKQQVVDHIMKLFDREDRIMWYLRRARAADLAEISLKEPAHFEQYKGALGGDEGLRKLLEGRDTAKARLARIVNAPVDTPKWTQRVEALYEEGQKLARHVAELTKILADAKEHQMKTVLDYNFPSEQSADDLIAQLKTRYAAEKAQLPDPRHLKPIDDENAVIEFPNGWAWVLVDKETCSREAGAMEHCGNSQYKEGDRIYSLREPIKHGTGNKKQKLWKPHLTFIINNGNVGEMKGFRNSKPKDEYHPYILKLLESPIVKHVVGGGYKAQNNFSLQDLERSQLQALLRKKPDIDKEKNQRDHDDNDNDHEGDDNYEDDDDH